MTRFAQAVFALLACATIGGFAIAQRLKQAAPVVSRVGVSTHVFSPHAAPPLNETVVHFELQRSDDVTVVVIDAADEVVQRLVVNRREPAGCRMFFGWRGRTEGGSLASPGTYRFQVGLRFQSRAIVLPSVVRLISGQPPRSAALPAPPRPYCPRSHP